MNTKIKIETHCHTNKTSPCADITLEELLEKYIRERYNGLVLTNHIAKGVFGNYPCETKKEKIEYYLSPYKRLKELCKDIDFKIFLGAEVCAVNPKGYQEFMIYGFDEKFLYDTKPLYEYTQEELFRLCEKNNLFMYQTHPFRENVLCGKGEFMHGAESFNGHFHHNNNNEKAKEFCEENQLIRLSGSDTHHNNQPITGGIFIPQEIESNKQLTEYIKNNNFERIEEDLKYKKAYIEYKKG